MARRRGAADWQRAICRASHLPGKTQVFLLYLSLHMSDARVVSIPRDQMSQDLNLSERKIAQRVREATDLGYLSRIAGGYRGVTAVYQGLFPGERVTATSTLSRSETGTLSKRRRVTPGDHATTSDQEGRVIPLRLVAGDASGA